MKTFGLYKKQKLCSQSDIDRLFMRGGADFACLHYPIRAIARRNDSRRSDADICFLISIPKKRLRHAVDRVTMRRRIREAFRLNHAEYPTENSRYDLAFIYVADRQVDYAHIERAVVKILKDLKEHSQTL